MLMEILMNGNRHVVTNAENGTKSVGAQTQMRIFTHVFKALSLLLHGIVRRAKTIDFDGFALDFYTLACTLTLYQCSCYPDTCACSNAFELFSIHRCGVDNNLNVVDGRTIVERNEINSLTVSVGAHPSFHEYIVIKVDAFEGVDYFCSFHFQS